MILPTRGRVKLFQNLCRSVQEMTKDLNSIEMLAVCDMDDKETYLAMYEMNYTWLSCFARKRGDSISRDYQNWIYPLSKGEYIIVLNDDVEFMTKDWDEIMLNKINNYISKNKDEIFYGWTSDSDNIRINNENNAYACFPVLSKKAIN